MNRVGLYQFKKYRIMNKTYKSGMMALSAVVFFTSCSESESLQQAHLSTDQINFIASMAHQWDANTKSAPQNPSSRSAGVRDNEAPIHVNANLAKPLYLHPVVQDGIHIWSKQGTPITRSGAPIEDVEQERVVQTRGSKKNDLSDYTSFNVSAVNTHDNPESLFFGYQKAVSVTSNSTTTWHVPDGINCWPEAPATLSFYAYAPTDNSMVSSGADATGVKTVHYKASTSAVTDQPDLIVSSAADSRQSNAKPAAVNLPFYHALTAVTFSVDAAMMPGTLTKVELVNVNTEGDCTMTASATPSTPSFSWSNQTTPSTFSFDFNQSVGSSAVTLTSGEQTLMMVPQELPADAKVNFTFTVNGVSQTLSAPIAGTHWEAGKSIIYKLSTNAVSTISAASVSFPTTWNDIAVTSATDKVSYPKKAFVDGESIGLYVVDDTGQLVGKNIKLTRNNNVWELNDNDKFMLLTRYKYFAYYPYSTTAPAVTASADNAADFFASKISSLSPASDQSAQNTLLAQDFQVAKGAFGPDGASLKLDMAHQVGLAVLNLTSKKVADTRRFKDDTYRYYYGLDNTVPTTSNYTDTGSKELMASNNFEGNKPYNVSGTKYLQVIPLKKKTSFMAADQAKTHRTAWGKLSTYSITPKTSVPVVLKNIQTDADFYYLARVYTCTQSVEEFTAPVAGEYKLECWGASGHNRFVEDAAFVLPGLGGYAAASYQIKTNHIIYICAGGYANGYNNKCDYTGSGLGGGATSITIEKGAELKEFSNKQDHDKVLLVAGGGGGIERPGKAGSGGGLKGLDGVSTWGDMQAYGTGGTQDAGGLNNQGNARPISIEYKACFGSGGIAAQNSPTEPGGLDFGGGGGGGWYGGGGTCYAGAAGGGSSHGNTSLLVKDSFVTIDGDNKMPSPDGGTEPGHSGHGACVITQLSFN